MAKAAALVANNLLDLRATGPLAGPASDNGGIVEDDLGCSRDQKGMTALEAQFGHEGSVTVIGLLASCQWISDDQTRSGRKGWTTGVYQNADSLGGMMFCLSFKCLAFSNLSISPARVLRMRLSPALLGSSPAKMPVDDCAPRAACGEMMAMIRGSNAGHPTHGGYSIKSTESDGGGPGSSNNIGRTGLSEIGGSALRLGRAHEVETQIDRVKVWQRRLR